MWFRWLVLCCLVLQSVFFLFLGARGGMVLLCLRGLFLLVLPYPTPGPGPDHKTSIRFAHHTDGRDERCYGLFMTAGGVAASCTKSPSHSVHAQHFIQSIFVRGAPAPSLHTATPPDLIMRNVDSFIKHMLIRYVNPFNGIKMKNFALQLLPFKSGNRTLAALLRA